jgi:hypothetical protein
MKMLDLAAFAAIGVTCCFPARAADAPKAPASCTDISSLKNAIESHHGRWINLTSDQWRFLEGVSALAPSTPEGIPPGDRAVMAQFDGDEGAVIFFLDGDKACFPMSVPDVIVEMLMEVGEGTIKHEGTSN